MNQVVLILGIVFTSLYGLTKKNDKVLILLITLSIFLDILNSQKYLNLTAIKLISITIAPWTLLKLKTFYKTSPTFKYFFFYLLFMLFVGCFYSFIFPWVDTTGTRPPKDLPPIRPLLHWGSWVLELNVAAFLGYKLQKEENFAFFKRCTFYSSVLILAGAILEKAFSYDFYHFFTAGREYLNPNRLRGFNYEPRGLAQNAAYAIVFLLGLTPSKTSYFIVILLTFFALFFSMSITGFVVFFLGLVILFIWFLLKGKINFLKKLTLIFALIITGLSLIVVNTPSLKSKFYYHLIDRAYIIDGSSITNKLEVFDAATVNFFTNNPKHLILGTGPGMAYLPASGYIIERDKKIWGNKIEALPHMGIILIVANTGILGLIFWLYFNAIGLKTLWKDRGLGSERSLIAITCLGIYLFQVRYFLIIGVAMILFPKKKINNLT